MVKKKEFDPVEKAKIKVMYEDGLSTAEIALKLNRSQRGIQRVVKQVKDLPITASPPGAKKRSGRVRTITAGQEKALKIYVRANPFTTARKIKRDVPGWENVSVRHIQRVLTCRLGFKNCKAAMKPKVTEAMRTKRLEFAKKYSSWTADQWMSVMFSDESLFRAYDSSDQRVWREEGSDRSDPELTTPTLKHGPQVMIWGAFSGNGGRGSLYFLEEKQTMNTDRYIEVIHDHLSRIMVTHRADYFLHDGAPCHAAKRTKEVLNEYGIRTIDWPGNSPDLNPIENLWSIMKRKLKYGEEKKEITSRPMLVEAIKNMWLFDIPPELYANLARSMPARLQAVIKNHGYPTKY